MESDEARDALRAAGFSHLAAYGHLYNGRGETITITTGGRTIRMTVELADGEVATVARPPPMSLGELDRDILLYLLSTHPKRPSRP